MQHLNTSKIDNVTSGTDTQQVIKNNGSNLYTLVSVFAVSILLSLVIYYTSEQMIGDRIANKSRASRAFNNMSTDKDIASDFKVSIPYYEFGDDVPTESKLDYNIQTNYSTPTEKPYENLDLNNIKSLDAMTTQNIDKDIVDIYHKTSKHIPYQELENEILKKKCHDQQIQISKLRDYITKNM